MSKKKTWFITGAGRGMGLGFAKDIVVVTESDLERHGSNPYLIIKPALGEGKELYHALILAEQVVGWAEGVLSEKGE